MRTSLNLIVGTYLQMQEFDFSSVVATYQESFRQEYRGPGAVPSVPQVNALMSRKDTAIPPRYHYTDQLYFADKIDGHVGYVPGAHAIFSQLLSRLLWGASTSNRGTFGNAFSSVSALMF